MIIDIVVCIDKPTVLHATGFFIIFTFQNLFIKNLWELKKYAMTIC